jgi:hypothetical protein
MRDKRATFRLARLKPGWPEEGRRRWQYPCGHSSDAPASGVDGGRVEELQGAGGKQFWGSAWEEDGRRGSPRGRPWRRVVLFEEVEEGRMGRGGRAQESKGGYASPCLRA